MKKILFALTSLLCILLISAGAFALEIGSETQKASNPDKNENVVLSEYLNGTYSSASCSIELSQEAKDMGIVNDTTSSSRYNLNLTYTLDVNKIKVSAFIPAALDAVDENGVPKNFFIGTIYCEGNNESLYMQRQNQLEFDKVYLNYKDDSDKLKDGDKIDDLKPGDSMSIDVDIENTYSSSDDIEIEDVELIIEADNDLDVDEKESIGDISENDQDSETVSFDFDEDADEGDYDLIIRTTGEDEYGALHGEQIIVTFEIDKEKDDVAFKAIDMYPDSISLCESPYATLTVSIENIGKNDQDEVSLSVKNQLLNYYQRLDQIELEEDDVKTKRFTIDVPETTKAGVYRFNIQVMNDDSEVTDSKEVSLLVKDCFEANTQTQQTSQEVVTTQVIASNQPIAGSLTSAQTSGGNLDVKKEEKSFELTVPMMIGLAVVLLLLIALMVFLILK